MKFSTNKSATECDRCGLWLPPGAGHRVGIDQETRKWRVRCARCAGYRPRVEHEIRTCEAVQEVIEIGDMGGLDRA
jgi:RNase P subunit RPR2